ncbi:MAG: acetylxylan esterase [Verrucomicrobiota bacterium]|jgi:hypothetical protein
MTSFRNTPVLVLAVLVCPALLAVPGVHFGPSPSVAPTGPSDFVVHAGSGVKATDAAGFLQRWLILDPIPANGVNQNAVQAAVKKEYFPNQLTVIPHDGDKVTVNGADLTWHALDTKFYNLSLYHFGLMFNKSTANVLMWGVTIVNSPEEMRNTRLAIGSNDASVWWVNGQEVIGIYGDRLTIIDDGVSKKLTLKKGPNVVRCAIHNQSGNTDFCARFLDANDQPITNLTVNLSEIVP